MTKEERAVAIIILITFLYGLGIYMQSGVFMVPVPLFPVFIFLIATYFAFLNFKNEKLISLLLVGGAFLEMIIAPVVMMFFMNEEDIQGFKYGDLIKLSGVILLISGIALALSDFKDLKNVFYAFGTASLILISVFLNSFWLYIVGMTLVCISPALISKRMYPIHLLALTILVLRTTEWVVLRFVS